MTDGSELTGMCVAVQWQPLAAVLLTPYLVGNVVSSLLLTTSWLTQMTSPPSSRESTISPMGGKRLPPACQARSPLSDLKRRTMLPQAFA